MPKTEKGLVTATSMHKGRPPLQFGSVTSPGRFSESDKMSLNSTAGESNPSSQNLASKFRTRLWRTMLSEEEEERRRKKKKEEERRQRRKRRSRGRSRRRSRRRRSRRRRSRRRSRRQQRS